MAETKVTKQTLKNAEKAAEDAKSAAGEATSAVEQITAEVDKAKEGFKLPEDPLGQLSDKVSELTSNVTKDLPDGIKKIGGAVFGSLDQENIVGSTYQELRTLTNNALDAAKVLTGKKSLGSLAGFVRPGENPQSILDGAAKGRLRTFVYPEDFSPDLCLRLDFLKFNRQNVFEPQKADPVSTFVFPLPKSIGVQQGTTYDAQELGAFGEVEARLRGGDFSGDLGEIATTVAKEAAGFGGSTIFRAMQGTDAGRIASLGVGFVPNPHLANIFKGVPLRTFTFEVSLAPRNQRESDTINHVMDHLRSYTLPAMSENRVTLDYPHEVALSFSAAGSSLVAGGQGKTPLDNIFKFKRCVVTNVNITVNGQTGTQAFFSDTSPVEISLSISFSESQIQTANDYGHKPKAVGSEKLADAFKSKFDEAKAAADAQIQAERARQENTE